MAYELIEALKREFWSGNKGNKEEDLQENSMIVEKEEETEQDAIQPRCDYCGNSINTRAYRMHGKIICSPCLHSRFDDYTSKTFKKITNKSIDEVRKI